MAKIVLKILLLCYICIQTIESAISIVNSDGEQTTTSAETKAKTKPKPSKQKTPHSSYKIMWITPFEIFNISTVEDNIIDPSINGIFSLYAQYLYNRFLTGMNDGTIKLNGIDEKASTNDKFFALQQYLHETNNLHGSDAVPKKELTMLKLQIKNVVSIYLQRCGVNSKVIKNALKTITIDGGNDENTGMDPSNKMFLWATMLSNGSYHAPHSHEHSIISGVYYAKIPTSKIDNDSDDSIGGYLVFGDPRGAGIYPFGLKYIHIPVEGQIVLFPGYLTHWVEPVKSSETRISFGFNIPGKWDDLSDTSMFYNF